MKNRLPWDLIVSKLRKELSPEDELLFNEWLLTNDNGHLFEQLEFVWGRVQQKVSVYEPDLEYYWNELSARIETSPVEKHEAKPTFCYDLPTDVLYVLLQQLPCCWEPHFL